MAGTTTSSRRGRGAGSETDQAACRNDLVVQFNALMDDWKTTCFMAPAPVIKTGGSALAKTGATATIASVGGVIVNVAAGTDLAALTGLTITANKFNVVFFCVAADGTTMSYFAGTEGSTLAAVVPPTSTGGLPVIAGAYITHSSTFTGGTTALDTATTVYFSTVGHRHASLLASKIGDSSGVAIAASS